MAERVTTSHTSAQAAIDSLREVAKRLAEIGDENVKQAERIEELECELADVERELADAERELSELEDAEDDALAMWREAIDDFRRGVRTQDELFAMTVDA